MAAIKRQVCGFNGNCTFSIWDTWGRWVAFAVIIAVAVLIFFAFACLSAHRRRKNGLRPYPGTSWMAPPPGSPPPDPPCYGDPYYQQNPPPQYANNSQSPSYEYIGSQPQPQREGQQEGQGQPPPQTEGIVLQAPPTAYQQDSRQINNERLDWSASSSCRDKSH